MEVEDVVEGWNGVVEGWEFVEFFVVGASEEGCERIEEDEGCGGGGWIAERGEENGGEIGWIQHHCEKIVMENEIWKFG